MRATLTLNGLSSYELVLDRAEFFWEKNILLLKLGKWAKNDSKIVFFNVLKNLATNFKGICSVVNIVVICYETAQILCLGKIFFQRYGPKCSRPIKM